MPEAQASQAAQSARAALDALADRYWQFQRHEFPLTAYMAGEPNDDATMFRESPADAERRAQTSAQMLAELGRIDPMALARTERITHRLLQRELEDLRSVVDTLSHLKPWLLPIGPEFNTVFFANMSQLGDQRAAERYVDRLATFAGYFGDVIACWREGLVRGLRYPRVVLEAALVNIRQAITDDAQATPWYGPFKRSPAASQPGFAQQAERAQQVISTAVMPALRAMLACMEGELLPAGRSSLACRHDPHGEACYAFWAQHFTTVPTLTPQAIHELGQREVARLDAEMAAVAADAGYGGRVAEYRRFLAEDPQFFAPSSAALLEQLQVVCKTIDSRIPQFFGRLPRITYGVQSIPVAASARMPPAYAQPNPTDGSSAGIFWVSGLPQKAPSTMHVPLALHEGWPGHLMHIALMQEMTTLPAFRRANFNRYSACLEGWALYCETLGLDMGLYQTPHQHFGRLEMEMWRACRLVVDTGLHLLDWSREQAIGTMQAHLSLSRETIEAEVDRYIAMPAQALGYQIGGLKFRELRGRAEQRLGARFNLRGLHDQLLAAGPVTLPALEEVVDGWLDAQAA